MPQDPPQHAVSLERSLETRARRHDGRVRQPARLRSEPYDWSADARGGQSRAARSQSPRGLAHAVVIGLGVVTVLIVSTGGLYQFALAVGWISGLQLGCGMVAIAIIGALPFSRKRCRDFVSGRGTAVAVVLVGLALSGSVLALAGMGDVAPRPESPRDPRPVEPRPLLAMPDLILPALADAHRLLHVQGDVWQWGERRIAGPDGRPVIEIASPITDVQPCGGGILVAYGAGQAARYSLRTGRQLGPAVAASNEPLTIACGAGSAFLGLGKEGGVLRVSMDDLTLQQAWIAVDGEVGGLLVRSDFSLVAAETTNGRVAHVSLQRNEVDHYTIGVAQAESFIPAAGGSTVAVAPHVACLSTVSWEANGPATPAVGVPGPIVGATANGRSLLVLANGGYWMQRIDLATMRPGPLIDAPGGVPATGTAEMGDGWWVLQPEARRKVFVSREELAALERSAARSRLTAGGPCV